MLTKKQKYNPMEQVPLNQSDAAAETSDDAEIGLYTQAVYRTVLDSAHNLIMLTDNKVKPVWANKAWIRKFGEKLDKYSDYFKFIHPDDLKEVRSEWSQLLKNGKMVRELVYRFRSDDHRYITLETSIYPVKLDDFTGYFFSSLDVSGKKFMEDQIIKTESILKKAEEIASIGSWEWDLQIGEFTLSENWQKIHGIKSHKIFFEDIFALIHPDDVHKMDEAFNHTLDGVKPYVLEHRIIKQDSGEVRIIETRGEVVKNRWGKPVKMYGAALDITELKETEKNLQEMDRKLKLAITSAELGMWEWDVETDKVYFDDQILEITGYRREDIKGDLEKGSWWKNRIHDDDKKTVEDNLEKFLSGVMQKYKIEYRLKNKSGNYIWVESTGQTASQSPEGKPKSVTGIYRNITQNKKLENESVKLNTQLKRKNNQMRKMLFATSHDLRSPLVNIQGFTMELKSSLLEMDSILKSGEIPETTAEVCSFILNEEIPELFNYILTSTEKMDTLLSGISLIAKLEQQPLNIEKINMNTMIREVLYKYESELNEKNIKIDLSDLPPCLGDQTMVIQVFANLVSNAVKFSDPLRNSELKIYSSNEERILYHVKDNGIGIPAGFQNKIFDLFYQIDSTQPGLGIGLTIVKLIVERLNGEITVESVENDGSCFSLFLPQE